MSARKTAPLGAGFRTLWTASAISTVGDGITLAAGPMLVASVTPDPAPEPSRRSASRRPGCCSD